MSVRYPCVYHNDGKCKLFSDEPSISFCVFGPCEYEKPSNADRIRAMSDEELATLLCCTGWKMAEERECLNWLQQPAEEADNAAD